MSQLKDESKVLTKNVQSKFNYYFKKLEGVLHKPEIRFLNETILGIIKSHGVFINQIALQLKEGIKLSKTTKRLRYHYNKEGFWKKLITMHIEKIKEKISDRDYAIVDLSDIQKRYALKMEGIAMVKDGDKDCTGMGYWLMNIIGVGRYGDIIPMYNKLYSFEKGTKSENKEILDGVQTVLDKIKKTLIWAIDRGADRDNIIHPMLKLKQLFVIRLTKKRSLWYQGEELKVNEISKEVSLKYKFKVEKTVKHKRQTVIFEAGAIPVKYKVGREEYDLWFMVTKRQNGGYAWFLINTDKTEEKEIVEENFRGYGYRWKIEEYHRHIKGQYHLENLQIKIFNGLQTMLSVVTIAMYLLYKEIESLHMRLLTSGGVKILQKEKYHELVNFIYYKIGSILKILFANVTGRTFLPDIQIKPSTYGQLCFTELLT